jgi:hypothetical protein
MHFDVFLCHHGSDKKAVEEIGRRLKAEGLRPWLDEWELRPGQRWQKELERQIATIPAVAVFVGPEGVGPWQDQEIDAFLRQAVKRGCPIIPVILPGCGDPPKLPIFLESYTWVDFRKVDPEPFARLLWGIGGETWGGSQIEVVEPKRRGIRLYSTKESVKNGEISALAIVETLAAVSLVFYLANHLNTLEWLTVAICVAPLLLLSTEESTRLCIDYWESSPLLAKLAYIPSPSAEKPTVGQFALAIFNVCAMCVAALVSAIAARFGATLVVTFRTPGRSVSAIPQNWARLAFATDSFCSIEPIPNHKDFEGGFWEYLTSAADAKFRLKELIALVFVSPIFAALFFPALFYRWSLKATSIIYAPFVFIAHQTSLRSGNVRDDLRVRKSSSIANLSVALGCIFILAFVAKLVYLREAQTFIDWWNSREVGEFLALYVAPAEIPKWQLSSLLNSVLAIVMFFFVREALVRIENNRGWPENVVQRTLGFTFGLRVVLSTYTILCTGYITIRAAQHWNWPAIAEKWFPWQ